MIAGVTRHMLSHLRGVPHLHVNRPLVLINKNIKSLLARDVHTCAQHRARPEKQIFGWSLKYYSFQFNGIRAVN